MGVRQRWTGPWGSAEADTVDEVRIGDRIVPRRIDVEFPSVDGQPGFAMTLEVVDGRPQCRSLRIEAVEGGREVRTLDLDAVRLAEWVEEFFALCARRIVEESEAGVVSVIETSTPELHTSAIRAVQQARKGKGARKKTPEFLARVADVYRAHIDGDPTKAVEEVFGVAPRTAAGYVQDCRRIGLLPETTRGKKRA